jgi:uncharacterized protein
MKNIKTMPLAAMIMMTVISFSNLLGLNIAGSSVILGVVFFFINKIVEKQSSKGSGLDLKAVATDFKHRKIWFWVALPLIMDAVSIALAKLFLPEYIDHVIARAGNFVSFEASIFLIFQLAFLALGEEIAWRAFFQNQLGKVLPITPVLLLSSALFAFGHLTEGNIIVVAYDIFFVFINSILYGVIFHRTKNAWTSGISHFIANLFSVIVFIIIAI